MKTAKIQQEILKALLDAGKGEARYFEFDLDSIFVTTDAKVGYVIPADELLVKLDGAQNMITYTDQMVATFQQGNILVGTDEYRNGGIARKYIRKFLPEEPVYVDTTLLKNFDNPELYQERGNPKEMIVVAENNFGRTEDRIVGIVMPTLVRD